MVGTAVVVVLMALVVAFVVVVFSIVVGARVVVTTGDVFGFSVVVARVVCGVGEVCVGGFVGFKVVNPGVLVSDS